MNLGSGDICLQRKIVFLYLIKDPMKMRKPFYASSRILHTNLQNNKPDAIMNY